MALEAGGGESDIPCDDALLRAEDATAVTLTQVALTAEGECGSDNPTGSSTSINDAIGAKPSLVAETNANPTPSQAVTSLTNSNITKNTKNMKISFPNFISSNAVDEEEYHTEKDLGRSLRRLEYYSVCLGTLPKNRHVALAGEVKQRVANWLVQANLAMLRRQYRQRLNEIIEFRPEADTGEPQDSDTGLTAAVNPNLSPEAACQLLNDVNSGDFEEALNEGGKRYHCTLEEPADDHDSEPLFLVRPPDNLNHYRSMMADLVFLDLDDRPCTVRAVVDSGAANCAIHEAFLLRHFPQVYRTMAPSERSFHDAQGNNMPVAGTVQLRFQIGTKVLTCSANVFSVLSTPILLGVNALRQNGMVINAYSSTMYIDPSVDHGERCHVALYCEDESLPRPTIEKSERSSAPTWTLQCHCSSAVSLVVDTDDCQLQLCSQSDSGQQLATVPCTPTTIPESAAAYTSTLVAAFDYSIPPGAKGFKVLLDFSCHTPCPLTALMVEPSGPLTCGTDSRPAPLRSPEAMLVNGANLHAFMHVANASDSDWVTIKAGDILAKAQQYTPPSASMWPSDYSSSSFIVEARPMATLPFSAGGPPTTKEHLQELGFDLSDSVDPDQPLADGSYAPLPAERQDALYRIALRWWWVWSRDARVPETSRLVVIDIPTGDAAPVAQKPYPIPYKFREAVVDELRKLLDGGLIEPAISAWASPILVRLKKDSTTEKIKLKIIVDYRRLNEVTIPDSASIGDQEEFLDGFGGRQIYAGIVDAAGGFYQFAIKPEDRHKTAFVLPTSMGGTSFQWRVAPYGLTRNPAGYSRGMMFALKGMACVRLAPLGRSSGGCNSWIDDVSMHADSFSGFADLFERLLMRMASASMSLKASKCFLLKARLEVLGYYVTPKGIVMQQDKLKALDKRDKDGNLVPPCSVEEIRSFLGAVQFYRRFIPRIALMATPMNEMLRKKPDPTKTSWQAVRESFEAIMAFLKTDAVVSAPDLSDPLAEYVICTDACDVAIGGVLLQWQHPSGRGPPPPAGVPLRGGKGTDPLTQSWRLDRGWQLRTIAYHSKGLNDTQRRYPTFDKESAAILTCVRKWAKIITCRPTTVYTDSSVATSMLRKHLGPPRLQRWGMELGTFLPFLKIAYRKGCDNGIADFISRYPTFKNIVTPRAEDESFPALDDVDLLPVTVPLFTHALPEAENYLRSARYELYEPRFPVVLTEVWASSQPECYDSPPGDVDAYLMAQMHTVREAIVASKDNSLSWASECEHWSQYVGVFETTMHRAPLLYDIGCADGTFSRGARTHGVQCYGSDADVAQKVRYEWESLSEDANFTCDSGMTFVEASPTSESFWDALTLLGGPSIVGLPDIIRVDSDRLRMGMALEPLVTTLVSVSRNRPPLSPLVWMVECVQGLPPCSLPAGVRQYQTCGRSPLGTIVGARVVITNFGLPLDETGLSVPLDITLPHSACLRQLHSGIASYCIPLAVASVLQLQFGCPLITPQDHDYRRAQLSWWANEGYGTSHVTREPSGVTTGDSTVDIPAVATAAASLGGGAATDVQLVHPSSIKTTHSPAEDERRLVATPDPSPAQDHTVTLRDATDVEGDAVPAPDESVMLEPQANPYEVTRARQLCDPSLAFIVRKLEGSASSADKASLERAWTMKGGLLCRLGVGSDGEVTHRIAVPQPDRGPLMRRFHHACHRGHEPLWHALSMDYYWPRMEQDCRAFTLACSVCGSVRSRTLQSAEVVPVASPSRPFEVIHIDHKGPLPKSGPYTSILVVVCALTRFTLYIPVQSQTAEETLKTLTARVFAVFGYPLVLVSDNGPAFRNELMQHMSKFFGFRHCPILPYNAQANGAAEASVKRIKLLLDRHCKGYVDWHKILPLAQLQLNTHVHTGHQMSPYAALFGREPYGVQHLENPSLLPDLSSGSEWLGEVKVRMQKIHGDIRVHSDAIKEARAKEANLRRRAELNKRAGRIEAGSYVRILRGSEQDAAFLRKHGHGTAWKFRYKVKRVTSHAVLLEVPTDGSVPRISEWQLIRRCEPAPDEEVHPQPDDPVLTEHGIPLSNDDDTLPLDDDEVYEIEHVLRAEKIKGRYRLWIKWKGYDDPTPMWRSDLLQQSSNAELRQEVDAAVDRCRLELGSRDEVDDGVEDEITEVIADLPDPDAPRLPRQRKPVDRYKPSVSTVCTSPLVYSLIGHLASC